MEAEHNPTPYQWRRCESEAEGSGARAVGGEAPGPGRGGEEISRGEVTSVGFDCDKHRTAGCATMTISNRSTRPSAENKSQMIKKNWAE
jgi:hypothetical protein